MGNKSDLLMRGGVLAFCAECDDERLFLPVCDECASDGCEFCCTTCDAAVFLLDVLDDVVVPRVRVA